MIESATKKHLAARKAPRREKHASYTFPPRETVLIIRPQGTEIETTTDGHDVRGTQRKFTAIQVQLPNGRTVSIQDLVENYAG